MESAIARAADLFGRGAHSLSSIEKALLASPKLALVIGRSVALPSIQLFLYRHVLSHEAALGRAEYWRALTGLSLNPNLSSRLVCELYLKDSSWFYHLCLNRRFSPGLALLLALKRDLGTEKVEELLCFSLQNEIRLKPAVLALAWRLGWRTGSDRIKELVANHPDSDPAYLCAWLEGSCLQAMELRREGFAEEDIDLLHCFFWE